MNAGQNYLENNKFLSSPLGERIQVRGKTSESISTLTPTLSRWREREFMSFFAGGGSHE